MKYYKCINEKGRDCFKNGVIYPENFKGPNGVFLLKKNILFSDDFEEVSRLDYIRQRGWYIRGSDRFRSWLDNNENKIDRKSFHANLTGLFYHLNGRGFLKSSRFNKLPKDKIEITVKELDQLYNENHDFSYPIINQTNENKSMFKPGDKIVILDTSLYKDYDYKVRTITDESFLFDWECDRSFVDSNNIRHATYEEIKIGHKLDTNKSTKMKNFQVKVTEHTFDILQNVAVSNGYKWAYVGKMSYKNNIKYIHFSISSKILHCSKYFGNEDAYPLISLEEAIERICQKEKFKDGDWLFHEDASTKWIFRYRNNEGETYYFHETFSVNSKIPYDKPGTINRVHKVRGATPDEIKTALIAIAQKRGFPSRKWKFKNTVFDNRNSEASWVYIKEEDILRDNGGTVYKKGEWATPIKTIDAFGFNVEGLPNGIYQFGCSDHDYTEDELYRVIDTLDKVPKEVSVGDLVKKLKEISRFEV